MNSNHESRTANPGVENLINSDAIAGDSRLGLGDSESHELPSRINQSPLNRQMSHETARPFVEAFHAVEDELPGKSNAWLRLLRRNALAEFARRGLPTPKDEAWKYSDLRRFASQLSQPVTLAAESQVDADMLAALTLKNMTSYRFVFVDGHFSEALSDIDVTLEGVTLKSLNRVLQGSPEKVEIYLNDNHISGRFALLNTAMMVDGGFIEIDSEVELDRPVELLFLSTGNAKQTHHIRNIVVAHERSKAVVIERYLSLGASQDFTNSVTDIELMAGSDVEHLKLQLAGEKQLHIDTVYARQHRDSRFVSHSIALGAKFSRTDIHVVLDGEEASCELNGLYLVAGRQHVDHHTRIDHVRPNCRSRENYKGVIDGRARAVFNGKVIVHKGADGTDSAQSNANLLLSDSAEVDTKPDLEIHADDVKCAHGATVGQLDMNQLFYLRSRGLSETEARNILTFAFVDEVLLSLPDEAVRHHIEQAALKKLPVDVELLG